MILNYLDFQAEQILSPHKSRSPVKSALPDLSESPARTFSPLSTVSVYNLTKSPIITTQVVQAKYYSFLAWQNTIHLKCIH